MSKLKDKLLASISNSEQKSAADSSPAAKTKAAVSNSPASSKKATKPKAKSSPKKAQTSKGSSYTILHPQRIWPD